MIVQHSRGDFLAARCAVLLAGSPFEGEAVIRVRTAVRERHHEFVFLLGVPGVQEICRQRRGAEQQRDSCRQPSCHSSAYRDPIHASTPVRPSGKNVEVLYLRANCSRSCPEGTVCVSCPSIRLLSPYQQMPTTARRPPARVVIANAPQCFGFRPRAPDCRHSHCHQCKATSGADRAFLDRKRTNK